MPYRNAHYFVGFVLLVIVVGFWASYFSVAGGVPTAFHVHAISSMAWLLLLIAQHVTIHRRQNGLHKQMGLASFALFPFLILGFVMIINVSARAYSAGSSPFHDYIAPAFGTAMVVAIAAYVTLFYLALKHRRNVRLHAGYMLATPLILFESPFSRFMDLLFPAWNFIGSEGPHAVLDVIAISDGLAILFALALYRMDRKHGAPWLVASFFMALQAVLTWFAPSIPILEDIFAAYTTIPEPLTMATGVALGAAAAWFGWEAGKAPRKRAAQPA
ncbi:MAG: hypothetical protein KJ872_10535 [Alphaproteobacteria bacterium]|nr:hypothetical protein [Alphaproteobacteria bacterium]